MRTLDEVLKDLKMAEKEYAEKLKKYTEDTDNEKQAVKESTQD